MKVAYAGAAPRVDDVSVTPTDTDGIDVVHPGDDDATSLHHDSTLSRGPRAHAGGLGISGGEPITRFTDLQVVVG